MSLFDMCCPKKPKKSLDYVIKWMENADKTFSNINASIAGINAAISVLQGDIKDLEDWKSVVESNISELVTEAIEDYDWSQLPVEALQTKADKVENAVLGHIASLDANGNLVDSGSGIDESIEQGNMDLATCNSVYVALQGKADSIHMHDAIRATNTEVGASRIRCIADEETGVKIKFYIAPNGQEDLDAEINKDNIANLNRALETPDEQPVSGSNKLITSGAIYEALGGLSSMDIYTVNYSSVSSGNTSISIANSTTVGTYNSFVEFISDNSSRIVSIFLTKALPNNLHCLATLVIGEEDTDPITGNSFWGCKLMIGNMEYECNVHDDTEVNSTFGLQS